MPLSTAQIDAKLADIATRRAALLATSVPAGVTAISTSGKSMAFSTGESIAKELAELDRQELYWQTMRDRVESGGRSMFSRTRITGLGS